MRRRKRCSRAARSRRSRSLRSRPACTNATSSTACSSPSPACLSPAVPLGRRGALRRALRQPHLRLAVPERRDRTASPASNAQNLWGVWTTAPVRSSPWARSSALGYQYLGARDVRGSAAGPAAAAARGPDAGVDDPRPCAGSTRARACGNARPARLRHHGRCWAWATSYCRLSAIGVRPRRSSTRYTSRARAKSIAELADLREYASAAQQTADHAFDHALRRHAEGTRTGRLDGLNAIIGHMPTATTRTGGDSSTSFSARSS